MKSKHLPLFFLLFVVITFGFRSVHGASKNETVSDPPVIPVPLDYQALSRELRVTLDLAKLDLVYIVDENVITYYYGGTSPTPYKLSHNPSYGEDDSSLGQVVDSYFDNSSVQATDDVEHNASLACMELGVGSTGSAIENYTLYTEVDNANNRITFNNATHVTHVSVRKEGTYLYRNYGAKTFYEYDITLEYYAGSHPDYSRAVPFMLSNWTGASYPHITNNKGYTMLNIYKSGSGSSRYVYLNGWNTTASVSDAYANYPLGQWLYLRVRQNATHTACWVYSDRAHTTLLKYLEIPWFAEYYSHVYSLNSMQYGSGTNTITYQQRNMRIFPAYGYIDGEYYTTELLGGDRALNLLVNTTIPAGTGITLEFSDDNATWVNHNDVSGYESLTAGFEAIDLRDLNTTTLYVRANLTTTSGLLTPRVYQLRLVTITGGESTDDMFVIGLVLGIGTLLGLLNLRR